MIVSRDAGYYSYPVYLHAIYFISNNLHEVMRCLLLPDHRNCSNAVLSNTRTLLNVNKDVPPIDINRWAIVIIWANGEAAVLVARFNYFNHCFSPSARSGALP